MAEPRLYLYRKADRSVWDAEMWLPDGRRTTWRTGLSDRDQAERAAAERLAGLVDAPTSHSFATAAKEPPELPAPASAGNQPAESATLAQVDLKSDRGWLQRLDAWFFSDLKNLLTKT